MNVKKQINVLKKVTTLLLISPIVVITSCSEDNNSLEEDNIFLEATQESEKAPSTLLTLSKWKLTVPKDGPDSGNEADEIYTNASENSDSNDGSLYNLHKAGKDYFYKSGNNWVNFRADAEDPTTGNSDNPRCELREMISGGTENKWWDLNSSTSRSLECTFKVIKTPNSKKVCFMQIHGDEDHDGWDDVIRLQVRTDDSNASEGDSGIVYVMGDVVDNKADDLFRYTLGETLKMTLHTKNGIVYVYRGLYKNGNGNDFELLKTYESDSERNYFKAGTYLQSKPSSGYGETSFNKIRFKVQS